MVWVANEVMLRGPKKWTSTLAPRMHGLVLQGHGLVLQVMGLLEDLFR